MKPSIGFFLFILVQNTNSFSQSDFRTVGINGSAAAKGGNDTLRPMDGYHTLDHSYKQYAVCGLNYAAASTGVITTRFDASSSTGIKGSGFPATLAISGIPACAVIEQAYLWWEVSYKPTSSTMPVANLTNPASVTNSYTGAIVGADVDKCWGETGVRTFRADVTSAVSGNGNYSLNITGNSAWEVDGATMIVIYRDIYATYQGSLLIDDGCFTAQGGFSTLKMWDIKACANSTSATAFLCVSDMQDSLIGPPNAIAPPNFGVTLYGVPKTYPRGFYNYCSAPVSVTTAQTMVLYGADSYTNAPPYECYAIFLMGLYYQTTSCKVCTPASSIILNGNSTSAGCGTSNGTASITASGGTSPYTYSWSPSGGTNSAATGLAAGQYTVTVKDNSSCNVSTYTINISSSGNLNFTTSTASVTCAGSNNGSATVAPPTGGTAPYTYAWAPSGGNSSAATGLAAGNYSVTVTDAGGCSTVQAVFISQPAVITATVSATATACGSANGSASVSAGGGIGAYTYSWNSSPVQSAQTATGLGAGTYSVQITDANGCNAFAVATINQPSSINASAISAPDTCSQNLGTATAIGSGGTTPYTYFWSNGQTTSTATALTASNYTCTVTDANGCASKGTVSVGNVGAAFVDAGSDISIQAGTSTVLTASGGVNYSWNTGETTNSIAVSPTVTTVYFVTATDAKGCSGSDTVVVMILEPVTDCSAAENPDAFILPNAFSPNGDRQNDNFHLLSAALLADCVKEFYISIYSRWGEKIFEGSGIDFMWDGTYKGKTEETAVFGYYLDAVLENELRVKKKGNITLLR